MYTSTHNIHMHSSISPQQIIKIPANHTHQQSLDAHTRHLPSSKHMKHTAKTHVCSNKQHANAEWLGSAHTKSTITTPQTIATTSSSDKYMARAVILTNREPLRPMHASVAGGAPSDDVYHLAGAAATSQLILALVLSLLALHFTQGAPADGRWHAAQQLVIDLLAHLAAEKQDRA